MKLKKIFVIEEANKKKKTLASKVTKEKDMESENEDCQSESGEYLDFMFKKFEKFLRYEKINCKILEAK